MDIKIDFRSNTPIYVQIMEQVQHLVANGQLQPGDQLPTVRQLAADLRINFNTVARAYRLLDEAGLISTQHGRGTYIWKKPSPATAQLIREHTLQELTLRYLGEAQRLGYLANEVQDAVTKQLAEWK